MVTPAGLAITSADASNPATTGVMSHEGDSPLASASEVAVVLGGPPFFCGAAPGAGSARLSAAPKALSLALFPPAAPASSSTMCLG